MDDAMKTAEVAYLVNGQVVLPEVYLQQQRDKMRELYTLFARRRDDWVAHRAKMGVETRWKRNMALYLGDDYDSIDSPMVRQLKEGPQRGGRNKEARRSKVVINIVRPKVDQAVARLCQILLPVDDRNWGIKPTPVPRMVQQMVGDPAPLVKPNGMPTGMSRDQAAQGFIEEARKRADAMQAEIDDVLTECDYNAQQREAIQDGVLLGTAIMIGPVPRVKTSRRWQTVGGQSSMVCEHTVVPHSHRADPWDVWFDPAAGNDHRRGAGFYYRKFVTRKDLRALVDVPGFDADAIREVLMGKPTRTRVVEGRVVRDPCTDESYEMWVYYGDVEPEHMALLSSFTDDPLEAVANGVVVMVDDTIIGAMDSLVPDKSLPCDVWCYRDADDTPQGFGLPDEMAHQQAVVTSAWRQVMDNARVGVGGQIVINKSKVKPQNGSYEWEPLKVWLADEDTEDVTKAMASVEFNSHLNELLAVAQAAMQFSDQETSLPQILGGEKGTAPETLGGMIMLYENANIVLRHRVKRYDDRMTRPHIGRHYDWQMAYNPREDIKGDMEVDARGSTALLEKDIQNQATLNLAAITSNPRYSAMLDPKRELKVILKALKIMPGELMLSDDEIDKKLQELAQNPPQDPNIVKAQAQVQVKQLDVQDKAQDRQFQAQMRTAELEHAKASLAYNADREEKEFRLGMVEAAMTRDITLLKAASDEHENEQERAARERLEAIKIDAANQRFNAEAALRVNTGEGI